MVVNLRVYRKKWNKKDQKLLYFDTMGHESIQGQNAYKKVNFFLCKKNQLFAYIFSFGPNYSFPGKTLEKDLLL